MKVQLNYQFIVETIRMMEELIKMDLLPKCENNFEENVYRFSQLEDSMLEARTIKNTLMSCTPINESDNGKMLSLIGKIDDFLIFSKSRQELIEKSI